MKLFASCHIAKVLQNVCGVDVLPLSPYKKLDTPVNTHADMLVFVLDKRVFCYEDYYTINKDIFNVAEKDGYKIVKISPPPSAKYPNDISLNVLKMGNLICGNLKYVAKDIINYALERGYSLIDVKQGYSACSTLVLDENIAITADKSIFNALSRAGKSITLVDEGCIRLDGYNYGFIGGASCVVGDSVCFFGDIKNHKNYDKIHAKILESKKREISISCGDVFDFGGARGF